MSTPGFEYRCLLERLASIEPRLLDGLDAGPHVRELLVGVEGKLLAFTSWAGTTLHTDPSHTVIQAHLLKCYPFLAGFREALASLGTELISAAPKRPQQGTGACESPLAASYTRRTGPLHTRADEFAVGPLSDYHRFYVHLLAAQLNLRRRVVPLDRRASRLRKAALALHIQRGGSAAEAGPECATGAAAYGASQEGSSPTEPLPGHIATLADYSMMFFRVRITNGISGASSTSGDGAAAGAGEDEEEEEELQQQGQRQQLEEDNQQQQGQGQVENSDGISVMLNHQEQATPAAEPPAAAAESAAAAGAPGSPGQLSPPLRFLPRLTGYTRCYDAVLIAELVHQQLGNGHAGAGGFVKVADAMALLRRHLEQQQEKTGGDATSLSACSLEAVDALPPLRRLALLLDPAAAHAHYAAQLGWPDQVLQVCPTPLRWLVDYAVSPPHAAVAGPSFEHSGPYPPAPSAQQLSHGWEWPAGTAASPSSSAGYHQLASGAPAHPQQRSRLEQQQVNSAHSLPAGWAAAAPHASARGHHPVVPTLRLQAEREKLHWRRHPHQQQHHYHSANTSTASSPANTPRGHTSRSAPVMLHSHQHPMFGYGSASPGIAGADRVTLRAPLTARSTAAADELQQVSQQMAALDVTTASSYQAAGSAIHSALLRSSLRPGFGSQGSLYGDMSAAPATDRSSSSMQDAEHEAAVSSDFAGMCAPTASCSSASSASASSGCTCPPTATATPCAACLSSPRHFMRAPLAARRVPSSAASSACASTVIDAPHRWDANTTVSQEDSPRMASFAMDAGSHISPLVSGLAGGLAGAASAATGVTESVTGLHSDHESVCSRSFSRVSSSSALSSMAAEHGSERSWYGQPKYIADSQAALWHARQQQQQQIRFIQEQQQQHYLQPVGGTAYWHQAMAAGALQVTIPTPPASGHVDFHGVAAGKRFGHRQQTAPQQHPRRDRAGHTRHRQHYEQQAYGADQAAYTRQLELEPARLPDYEQQQQLLQYQQQARYNAQQHEMPGQTHMHWTQERYLLHAAAGAAPADPGYAAVAAAPHLHRQAHMLAGSHQHPAAAVEAQPQQQQIAPQAHGLNRNSQQFWSAAPPAAIPPGSGAAPLNHGWLRADGVESLLPSQLLA